MKKFVFIIIVTITFVGVTFVSVYAQDTTKTKDTTQWSRGGIFGLNFSQMGLKDWSGGGKSSISLNALVSLYGKFKGIESIWDNYLELGYGMTKQQTPDFRKSDDHVLFTSQYGYRASKELSYSALLDFRTQFNEGLNYDKVDSITGKPTKISNFMAPAYINLGLGLNYQPTDYLQIMLAPIANRLIIVLDDTLSQQGAFGVDKGKKIKSELGASFNMFFKKEVMTNVTLQTRLNLFDAYNDLTKVVVTWETLINMKINDFLTASVSTQLFYDDKVDILRDNGTKGPATQFRDIISIGFAYQWR